MGQVDRFNSNDIVSCTLNDWLELHNSVEEKRETFLNMDKALKYIHEHDYGVERFFNNSTMVYDIDVLNNNSSYIKFNRILPLTGDLVAKQSKKNEDIFASCLIQICSYVGIPLNRLNLAFLKENFDEFSKILPPEDVPYYRGIILRGSSVYFSDYISEIHRRKLSSMENQLSDSSSSQIKNEGRKSIESDKSLVKMSKNRLYLDSSDKNNSIYKIGNNDKEAAFINYLLIITILVFSLLAINMFFWLCSLI